MNGSCIMSLNFRIEDKAREMGMVYPDEIKVDLKGAGESGDN
ncbi:hypothetical protein [Alkalibacter mobilis]|nr:hypothetical protein [Alkalibacter mobilis]